MGMGLFIALLLSMPSGLLAQTAGSDDAAETAEATAATPFRNFNAALYVSKSGFVFSSHYHDAFAAFLRKMDTIGLQKEFLKLGMSVRLGNYLKTAFKEDLGVDSTLFINSRETVAAPFIRHHNAGKLGTDWLREQFTPFRYVLSLDTLRLGTETRRSVFAVSNRIRTERRNVKVARLRLRVWDLASDQGPVNIAFSWDEENSPPAPAHLGLAGRLSPAATFLDRIFNHALEKSFQALP